MMGKKKKRTGLRDVRRDESQPPPPESSPDDMVSTGFGPISRAELSRRGRKGVYAMHASRTPQERSEAARHAAKALWEKKNAERAAAGLPPTRKRAPLLSNEELQPWLEEVDRRFPDREWISHEERRRQALLIARQAIAEATHEALKASRND